MRVATFGAETARIVAIGVAKFLAVPRPGRWLALLKTQAHELTHAIALAILEPHDTKGGQTYKLNGTSGACNRPFDC